ALCRPGGLLQDPGTGWHLVTGRLILETGSIPAHDLFSYTAAGHEWINLAWLFEAASALLVRTGGLPLFATACVLVYAFLPVLVFRDAEERRRALVFAAVLAAMGLATLVNPHGPRLHTAVQEYLSLRSIRYFHEFQSPDFLAGSVPVLSFEALTLMLILVLGLGGRRLPWVAMALLVLLLRQALHSARHMN